MHFSKNLYPDFGAVTIRFPPHPQLHFGPIRGQLRSRAWQMTFHDRMPYCNRPTSSSITHHHCGSASPASPAWRQHGVVSAPPSCATLTSGAAGYLARLRLPSLRSRQRLRLLVLLPRSRGTKSLARQCLPLDGGCGHPVFSGVAVVAAAERAGPNPTKPNNLGAAACGAMGAL